jgi:hypothetical protein
MCDVLASPKDTACRGYLSERSSPNIGNTWGKFFLLSLEAPVWLSALYPFRWTLVLQVWWVYKSVMMK